MTIWNVHYISKILLLNSKSYLLVIENINTLSMCMNIKGVEYEGNHEMTSADSTTMNTYTQNGILRSNLRNSAKMTQPTLCIIAEWYLEPEK